MTIATRIRLAASAALAAAALLVGAGPARAATPGAALAHAPAHRSPAATAHAAFRVPHQPANMADYLTMVLNDVHAYWSSVYSRAGLAAPHVRYLWLAAGQVLRAGCGGRTDDATAYYCPRDDTIYFSQQYAVELWDETQDFGVAAAIAHEYAHNVQRDLGVFRLRRRSDMPFELMADCMAGMWANWAYYEGQLEAGDVNEAASAFYDVGDRRFRSRHHHGTPRQRRAAFLRGYAGGGRAHCERYLRKSRRSAHRR